MIGTHFDTMGGISAVVNVYRASGMFERRSVEYLPTHCDGGAKPKLLILGRALTRYWVLLLTRRVGLLHAHVSSRASFWRKALFFLPAFLLRVPTILHLHGSEFAAFYETECGAFRKCLVRYIFNHVSRVVVLSRSWKEWVRGVSTNPHVETIYNPVELPRVASRFSDRERGVVLSLGRLGKRKGTYDLLQAVARTVPHCPTLRLLLGGDGETEAVRAYALKGGISDRVRLLGWVRGQAKERHLDSAMIYALPSYHEGLPMSILEAMAAGMPILTTPIGGIPEAVTDGVEGFLVEPGDIDALADKLRRLIADASLAQRMGAAARKKVETTFSAAAVLPRVEKLYRDLGLVL